MPPTWLYYPGILVRSVRSKIYRNRDKARKSTKLGTNEVRILQIISEGVPQKFPPGGGGGGEGRGIFVNETLFWHVNTLELS